MANIVVFGGGDIASLAHFYFSRDSSHRVVAFTVDRQYRNADQFEGLPFVDFETVRERFSPTDHQMFVAVSYTNMNQLRATKYAHAKEMGYTLASYVSSRCTNLADQPVGDNCFILEDNTIQPFVKIGSNVTLWSGNHIGHHSTIADHCFIASHVVVSGHVDIGARCFIGVNATLRNGIRIGAESLIGAGAVIMKDTVERGVYLAPRSELAPKSSDQIKL